MKKQKRLRILRDVGLCIPIAEPSNKTSEWHQLSDGYIPLGELEGLMPVQQTLVFAAVRKSIRRGRKQNLKKIIRIITAPTKNRFVLSKGYIPLGELEGFTPKQRMLVVHWVRAGRLPCARLLRRRIPNPNQLAQVCLKILELLHY